MGDAFWQTPPLDIPRLLPQDIMAEQKDRSSNEAKVKYKGNDGKCWAQSHIFASKGNDPMEDGAESIFPMEIWQDYLFFGSSIKHGKQSIDTPTDEDNKGNPYERTMCEFINGLHNPSFVVCRT